MQTSSWPRYKGEKIKLKAGLIILSPLGEKTQWDEEQLAKIELRDKVDKAYLNGVLITLSNILSLITSLQQEQPEVDLEKEISDTCRGYRINDYHEQELGKQDIENIARHFYELGKKVRK